MYIRSYKLFEKVLKYKTLEESIELIRNMTGKYYETKSSYPELFCDFDEGYISVTFHNDEEDIDYEFIMKKAFELKVDNWESFCIKVLDQMIEELEGFVDDICSFVNAAMNEDS